MRGRREVWKEGGRAGERECNEADRAADKEAYREVDREAAWRQRMNEEGR